MQKSRRVQLYLSKVGLGEGRETNQPTSVGSPLVPYQSVKGGSIGAYARGTYL